MKKKLLLVTLIALWVGAIIAQSVDVPIENHSFELPEGGAKITNPEDMPGWHCDNSTDSGREGNDAAPLVMLWIKMIIFIRLLKLFQLVKLDIYSTFSQEFHGLRMNLLL